MGKSGDLLRKKKADNVKYTYTKAQMEEHDKKVRHDFEKIVMQKAKQHCDDYIAQYKAQVEKAIDEEWQSRYDEFRDQDAETDFNNWMRYFVTIGIRILVEEFKYPLPPSSINDRRYKIGRWVDRFFSIMQEISTTEELDIRTYAKETADKYGYSFELAEEE